MHKITGIHSHLSLLIRHELYSILSNDEVYRVYHENNSADAIIDPKIAYEDVSTHN